VSTDPVPGASNEPDPSLERALERLEEITALLDAGEIELSEALALYEEGVRLIRVADAVLGSAEERIQRLRPDGAGFRLENG
jgi:exodeoxyribonuclease VII small subunit